MSIEQTLRTYEEIWLSKVFKLEVYDSQKYENLNSSGMEEVIFSFSETIS